MQAKALELGEGERLTYIYPHGQCGSRATNCSHASITHCGCPNSTEAAAASALQLGARLVLDAHPTGPKNEGGLGHDVPVFQADFANPIFNIDHGSRWGAAARLGRHLRSRHCRQQDGGYRVQPASPSTGGSPRTCGQGTPAAATN